VTYGIAQKAVSPLVCTSSFLQFKKNHKLKKCSSIAILLARFAAATPLNLHFSIMSKLLARARGDVVLAVP